MVRRWARASSATASTSAGRDGRPALVGGEGRGGLVDREVGAEALGPLVGAAGADGVEDGVGDDDRREELLGRGDPLAFAAVGLGPARGEGGRVGLEGEAAADDLGADGRVGHRLDVDGQAEAVEQLGPEVAFLGVHRADQDEPRRVAERHPLALDVVDAHRGGVEQEVDEVVAEQVDLVDVEDAPVGRGEQAGLERAGAGAQGALEVQAADDAVLGRPDRQVHQRDRARTGRGVLGQGPAGDVLARGPAEGSPG